MNKVVCDICGIEKSESKNAKIEGSLRICKRTTFDKGNTVLLTVENKDVFLCERCSGLMMKCADALREHKRIKFGREKI